MLEGWDFIILSKEEVRILYKVLEVKASLVGYKEHQKLGILEIMTRIKKLLDRGM